MDVQFESRWIDERLAGGLSVATANRYLVIVSRVFAWAVERGECDVNPARSVKRFSEKGRERNLFLTTEQVDELVKAAPDEFKPVIRLAAGTGLRAGEILAAEWRDVDLKAGEIVVRPEVSKTGVGRSVPLLASAVETLRALPGARFGKAPVIARLDGRPWTYTMLRRRWLKTLEGVKLPEDVRESVCFHSLRHHLASRLATAGTSMPIIAKILGHTLVATSARYSHLSPSATQAAVAALERATNV